MQKRSALESALNWLERADRSQTELENYLSTKKYESSEITEAILKLQSYGYLDDELLANRVTAALRKNLHGELKIKQKLEKKGLEAPATDSNGSERAFTLLSKKFSKCQNSSDSKDWARAARHLATQGYTEEEIEEAITKFFPRCET